MNVLKRAISFLTAAVMFTTALAVSVPVHALEETTEPSVQTDANMEIEGSNTLGNLLVQAVEESTDETDSSTEEECFDSYISSIDMEYGYAYVRFTSVSDATLVVALYDEVTGQMLTSSSVAVAAGDTDVEVAFDVMPEDYFIVKGYLVNTVNFAPISEVFENTMYTQSKQEFYAKTPEDFDSERVLVFDETSADNFAVFDESATLVQYSEGANIVAVNDPSTGTYVIENVDNIIQNLSSGEVLVLYYGDELPLMVKVDTIVVDGNAVTITAGDIALSDVFEFFRLDTGYCEPDYENAELADGVTVETNAEPIEDAAEDTSTEEASYAAITTGIVGADDEGFDLDDGIVIPTESTSEKSDTSVKDGFTFSEDGLGNKSYGYTNTLSLNLGEKKFEDFKSETNYIPKNPDGTIIGDSGNSSVITGNAALSGTVKCQLGAKLTINWDKDGEGSNYVAVEFSSKMTSDVTLSNSISVDIPLLLQKLVIPLPAGFDITVNPSVHLESNASISLNTSYTNLLGFSYDETRTDKLQEIKHTNKAELGFKIDGSLYVGVNINPALIWYNENLFAVDFEELGCGILITGKLVNISEDVTREEIMSYQHEEANTGTSGGGSAWINNNDVIVDSSLLDEKTEEHLCTACIDGEMQAQVRIKIQLKILDLFGEHEVIPPISVNLPSIHLAYFHVNLMDADGNPCFRTDFGKCPNKAFLCEIICRDKDTNAAVKNAEVIISDSDGNSDNGQTDKNGKVKAWLVPDTYNISASADGYGAVTEGSYTLTYRSVPKETANKLNDEEYVLFIGNLQKRDISLDMTSDTYEITATIVDEEGNEIEGATTICSYTSKVVLHKALDTITIAGNAITSIAATAANALYKNMTGDYPEIETKLSPSSTLYRLPDGTHTFTVTCPGYGIQKFDVTVDGADKDVKFVLDDGIYNISVSVVDSDGDPIESATVTSSCTDLTESLDTEEYGCAFFQCRNGEYTFTAEKIGYVTAEQIITIDGKDADVEFVLDDDLNYRIRENVVYQGGWVNMSPAAPRYTKFFTLTGDQIAIDIEPIMGLPQTITFDVEDIKGNVYYLKNGVWRFNTASYNLSDATIIVNEDKSLDLTFKKDTTNYENHFDLPAEEVSTSLQTVSVEVNQKYEYVNNTKILLNSAIIEGENTANFTSITPDTIYNLYCMKSNESETPFSTDNLLYMSQIISDADGNLDISFIPTEAYDDGDVFVVSPTGEVIVYGEETEETMEAVSLTMLQTLQLDSEATLISSDSSVATIDESGRARAVGEGYAAVFSLTDEGAELLTVIVVTEPDYLIGDVNGDGAVSLDDASMTLSIYASKAAGLSLDSFTDEQLSIADVDSDGTVSLSDASAILSYYAQQAAGLNPAWATIFAV